MDIVLIRHGEASPTLESYNPVKNRRDPPLTARGMVQAGQLAQRLKALPLGCIYSSDLRRALQTAEILNQARSQPVEIEIRPELREIDMGLLHLSSWEEYAQEDADYVARWHDHITDLPYPGGECGEDVRRRTWPVILEIIQNWQQTGLTVALVAHGGVIRTLLCAVLGIPQEKRFLFGAPLHNCGLSVLRYNSETQAFSLQTVNDVAHLNHATHLLDAPHLNNTENCPGF